MLRIFGIKKYIHWAYIKSQLSSASFRNKRWYRFGISSQCKLTSTYVYNFSSDTHNYKHKTTKQIQIEISKQRWKQLQNTFKSVNSKFGLKKPSLDDVKSAKYAQPDKIEYTLQTLRSCSQNYPVYLQIQLERDNSPFNKLIQKVIGNLWKAEQAQAMQFLQFLYHWDYKKVDVQLLYQRVIQKSQLSLEQLFQILKLFQGKISKTIQIKVLKRLQKADLLSNQYNALFKIVNFYTVKNLLTPQFYIAVTRIVKNNINRIPPTEALQIYVYYTYNINQHLGEKQQTSKQQTKQDQINTENLSMNILNIIEKRLLAEQCLKFYNGQQLVALLHTFLKNNLILQDTSGTKQYDVKISKIIERVSLNYFVHQFSIKQKINLLELSSLLPQVKKMTIIALVQKQLLKKQQKFSHAILPNLYLLSYQNNMLTDELKDKIQHLLAENIFNIQRKDISRILWMATITRAKNLNTIHKKIQSIAQGGFRDMNIKDITIFVWSMSSQDYNRQGKFWNNMESFLHEQLARSYQKIKQRQISTSEQVKNKTQDQLKQENAQQKKLINNCCWILWAYYNNRSLKLKTIDLISQILISRFKSQPNTSQKVSRVALDEQNTMTVFQLTSIISFYYSIDFPSQTIIQQIKKICVQQYKKIFKTMEPIQLCKCLKFLGSEIWKDKEMANQTFQIIEVQIQNIAYQDIAAVMAILISSGIKNKRVTTLLQKLIQRKKRLQSLQQMQDPSQKQQNAKKGKQGRWKFPIFN